MGRNQRYYGWRCDEEYGVENDFDDISEVFVTKRRSYNEAHQWARDQQPSLVYTDGACTNNGRSNARAGWGVHIPGGKDINGRLHGDIQTNQRAELTAILKAVDNTPHDRRLLVKTDSKYSIQCLTEWMPKWERNGWKTSTGAPVKNRDLLQEISSKIEHRDVEFEHVSGHSGNPGNDRADQLANEALR